MIDPLAQIVDTIYMYLAHVTCYLVDTVYCIYHIVLIVHLSIGSKNLSI